jgi:hypothetical protein
MGCVAKVTERLSPEVGLRHFADAGSVVMFEYPEKGEREKGG